MGGGGALSALALGSAGHEGRGTRRTYTARAFRCRIAQTPLLLVGTDTRRTSGTLVYVN